MRSSACVLAIVAFAILGSGCDSATDPETVTYCYETRESDTDLPIPGVEIYVLFREHALGWGGGYGERVTTGADGTVCFETAYLDNAPLEVTVSHPDYVNRSFDGVPVPDPIFLQPVGWIRLRLFDAHPEASPDNVDWVLGFFTRMRFRDTPVDTTVVASLAPGLVSLTFETYSNSWDDRQERVETVAVAARDTVEFTFEF